MSADCHRLVREKLVKNAKIIEENVDIIEKQIAILKAAMATISMDEMSEALRIIVDNGVGCRARLQFMRGAWAMYRSVKDEEAKREIQPGKE